MTKRPPFAALGVVLSMALLAGLMACGGKPLHPDKWQEPPAENMEGPGLFSGEDGEWIIYED